MSAVTTKKSNHPPISVQILRDHTLDTQDLWMEVYIHCPGQEWEEQAFAPYFARARCRKAKSPEKADLVVFVGGVDVDPELYGEKRHMNTERPDHDRDRADMDMYLFCLERGIPMMGVCRGAQFLHVMQGGKLFQHVDNHGGRHAMFDVRTKMHIQQISSVHHQMVIPQQGMEIIATAAQSRVRHRNPERQEHGPYADVEAFFYRDACIFGVQGHPEYTGYNYFTKWSYDMLYDLIVTNPDIENRGGYYRIKEGLLLDRGISICRTPVEAASAEAIETNQSY